VAGAVGLVWMAAADAVRHPAAMLMTLSPASLPADGFSRAEIVLRDDSGHGLRAERISLRVIAGNHSARVVSIREAGGEIAAQVEAGIVPGTVELEAQAAGMAPARALLATRLDPGDRAGDGTPDFLRLDAPADRDAFRRWFTFLAEAQAFAAPQALPHEIVDCAALARFAYREALRPHDAAWAEPLHLAALPAIPGIEKYAYPFTPLGAGLFRVRPGAFAASDLTDGAFAEFADAKTLSRLNAHFVTRNVARAQPGDLLFYRRHAEPAEPSENAGTTDSDSYHTMIFVGRSQMEPAREVWVVYHTGPLRNGPGEIRRIALADLLRHPEPRWRPVEANPFFLGVYRWNILRGAQ